MIRVLPLYDTYIIQIREKKGIACLNKNSLLICAVLTIVQSAMIADLIPFQADIIDQFTEFPVRFSQK